MADVAALLAATKTILLVDWPSRDVPDTLARHGYTVFSEEDEVRVYEAQGSEVRVRSVERLPEHADLVYAHRPIDELQGIVETAKSIGAKAIWLQSGRDSTGAKDPRGCWSLPEESAKAHAIVEGGSLAYIESPYIADAVRALT
jgi:predicted CoA-binding protein